MEDATDKDLKSELLEFVHYVTRSHCRDDCRYAACARLTTFVEDCDFKYGAPSRADEARDFLAGRRIQDE